MSTYDPDARNARRVIFFFLTNRRPPGSTLFPYPTLFRSVLTHPDLPQLDSIELFNPSSTNVDIGNWYLTDQRTVPQKFRIPAPKVVPAGGYLVFTENDFNANPNATNGFRLDSHGEEVYLYSADANGNLTGYSDGFSFGR